MRSPRLIAVLLLALPAPLDVRPGGFSPELVESQPGLTQPVSPETPVEARPPIVEVESLAFGASSRSVAAGEVLLQLADGPEARAALGALDLEVLAWNATTRALRVRLPRGETVAAGLQRLRGAGLQPMPNAIVWSTKKAAPAEVEAAGSGGRCAHCPDGADLIDLAGAHTVQGHAASTTVALLDSGIASAMPSLASTSFQPGWDFVDDDKLAEDEHQHGSHLASVVARCSMKGRLMAVRVLDHNAMGTEFDVAQGISWATAKGADVINLSLGFGPYYTPSPVMADALDAAIDKGIVIFAAAGNDGDSLVSFPAALAGIIAVGAVDDEGNLATYSNSGAALDVVAPGGGIGRSEGVGAMSFPLNQPGKFTTIGLVGTSVAAAYASGVASLMLEIDPSLRPAEVQAMMLSTSSAVADRHDYNPHSGGGLLDARALVDLVVAHKANPADRTLPQTDLDTTSASASVFIEQVGDARRAVALIELLDAELRPMAGATVHGDWVGSQRGNVSCTTDAYGRCLIESATVNGDALIFGLHVNRAEDAQGRLSVPNPGNRVAPDAATTYQSLFGEQGPAVVAGFAGATPGAESLLDGRTLSPSYQHQALGLARVGSSLVIAFDQAYLDQMGALSLHVVPDGLRLATEGEGAPFLWVNDQPSEVIAEATGMMGSTWDLDFDWYFNLFYDGDAWTGGLGMMGSTWVFGFWDSGLYWDFNDSTYGEDWSGFGAGMMGSTWDLWLMFGFDYDTGF